MDERVEELEKLLRMAMEGSSHADGCARANGLFTDESLCDCWVRDARAALSGAPLRTSTDWHTSQAHEDCDPGVCEVLADQVALGILREQATDQEAPEARGPVGPPLDAQSVDSRAAAAPEAGEPHPLDPRPPTWRDRLCACGHRRGEHGGPNEAGRCDHGCCHHDCNPERDPVRTSRLDLGAGTALRAHYDNHGKDEEDCELCGFWLNAPAADPPSEKPAAPSPRPPEPRPCLNCGDPPDAHTDGRGQCVRLGCTCLAFVADGAPRPPETGGWADAETLFEMAGQAMTAAVREADDQFQTVGGSSRHWVRDCFIPALAKAGLGIVPLDELNRLQKAVQRAPPPGPAPAAASAGLEDRFAFAVDGVVTAFGLTLLTKCAHADGYAGDPGKWPLKCCVDCAEEAIARAASAGEGALREGRKGLPVEEGE